MDDPIIVMRDTVIHGPHPQAYRIRRDIRRCERVRSEDFEALGGAPEPASGKAMPEWLARFVNAVPRGSDF